MAHRRCWLTKAVRLDGKTKTRRPVFTPKGNRLTNKVVHNGKEVEMDGQFILEWYEKGRRIRRNVGSEAMHAHEELIRQRSKLQARVAGVEVVEEPDTHKHDLEFATKVYISHLRSKEREEKTITGIKQNLELLEQATGRSYLEDLKQADILEKFVSALREKGYSKQTVFDRYARVVSFLKFCSTKFGTKRVVELNDGPSRPRPKHDEDFSKKDPYTEAELNILFRKSTPDERLLWKFFLDTGAREKEVIYATWKDVDLDHRLFHIRSNEKLGFRTKNRSSRTVPFTQELADALRALKSRSKGLLVFGKDGKPQRHMIRILKQTALDAKLNCGLCVNSTGLSCGEHPICENWFLHRFRHTFANYHLRHGRDIATVSQWLGHSDLATTAIYAHAIKSKSDDTKLKVDSTFAGVKTGLL